jgi:outer membrane lipoprotein
MLLPLIAGCARVSVLPDAIAARVDPDLTFSQLQASPDSYKGHLVVLGGEVLRVTPAKGGSWIEVLHLPLDSWNIPKAERTASEGRFFAFRKGALDPAVLEGRMPVTIIGEVAGAATRSLGGSNTVLPLLRVESLTAWEKRPTAASRWDKPPYAPYRFFLLSSN